MFVELGAEVRSGDLVCRMHDIARTGSEPLDDHATTFPCMSLIVISVLLNVAVTCAIPSGMFLRTRFFVFRSLAAMEPYLPFFLVTVRRGPFRVRAFVCVR